MKKQLNLLNKETDPDFVVSKNTNTIKWKMDEYMFLHVQSRLFDYISVQKYEEDPLGYTLLQHVFVKFDSLSIKSSVMLTKPQAIVLGIFFSEVTEQEQDVKLARKFFKMLKL